MAAKNKYARRSRISEAKIRGVVRYFSADLTTLQSARLSGLNQNTINRLYKALRERFHVACEAQRPLFGTHERDGIVYTEIVPDSKQSHSRTDRIAETANTLNLPLEGKLTPPPHSRRKKPFIRQN
jgi:hypothetical protein